MAKYGGVGKKNRAKAQSSSKDKLELYLEQNSRSIILDIPASTVERPSHLFRFKPYSAN